MKTVSGSVISSKPISLSKAASVLNSFVSVETGASIAVSAYLRRASASFEELVQLHRELKSERSERKRKKSRLDTVVNGNLMDAEKNPREDGPATERGRIHDLVEEKSIRGSEGGDIDEEDMKSWRKKKKKVKSDYRPEVEEREGGGRVEIEEEEKGKERKKRKKVEIEYSNLDNSDERHSRKKKKRKYEGEN